MLFPKPKIDSIESLENPNFIKPMKINYTLKNKQRVWEAVESHDSVSILIYHTQLKSFILVKQLRVTVLNRNKRDGMMYELCAGIVDKDTTLAQIAKEEVLEECGYDIPLNSLEKITSVYSAVGISGSEQTLYFTTVDDSMKIDDGGGLEEEDIEVIYIKLQDAKEFMLNEKYQKTTGLMMAFYWFFDNKL
ncbi:MAG: NUDIX hydrolase [Campylobacterota bacterium]|nr:NUDIX hydrolase [Campylobacterota bacterium]